MCSILNRSAPQDIIPVSVPNHIIKTFPVMLTDAINCVLCSGILPNKLKHGVIMPFYKKEDVNELKKYRPVTNLRTVAKIIEKVVLCQMENHLWLNGLWPIHQSGYTKNHSTETSIISLEATQKSIDQRKCASIITGFVLGLRYCAVSYVIHSEKQIWVFRNGPRVLRNIPQREIFAGHSEWQVFS